MPVWFEALAIGLLLLSGLIDTRVTLALAVALVVVGLAVITRAGGSPRHQH